MYNEIRPGLRNSLELKVEPGMSARNYGSGMVDVLATPAMIALMERTALESIHPYLQEGYTSVGTEVNMKHLKATPIGADIRIDSRLREITGRKMIFELHAWDKTGMIGIGTHTRVIVEEKGFIEKIS